jgi:hypothetical protein
LPLSSDGFGTSHLTPLFLRLSPISSSNNEKQFSTKELQEAPLPKNHRKLQENHNVFNEYSRQNANAIDQFRRRTNHLHREAQIVQSNIRQQESYRSEAPSGQSRPASYLEYSQETASAPFMNIGHHTKHET